MKLFVAGASGRVGRALVDRLAARGVDVVAGSRHACDQDWPVGARAVECDLHWNVDRLASCLAGCDGVYFVAGSRGKDLLQVDAFGAVKLMEAAERVGALRYVQLSSMFAMEPERWEDEPALASLMNYNIAKFFADEWLVRNSGLEWTIVQPGVLTEEAPTGRVEFNPTTGGSNPIPDVAEVLALAIDYPNALHQVIIMKSGDTPIELALVEL